MTSDPSLTDAELTALERAARENAFASRDLSPCSADVLLRLLAAYREAQVENDKLNARLIVAEHHKLMDRLGRSSYQEVVEDGLRTKLAETELERDALQAEKKERS